MLQLDYLGVIVGAKKGGEGITSVTAKDGEWRAMVVNEACVIAELHVDGVDVAASRGLTEITWAPGIFIGAGIKRGSKITHVDLEEGSAMLY